MEVYLGENHILCTLKHQIGRQNEGKNFQLEFV